MKGDVTGEIAMKPVHGDRFLHQSGVCRYRAQQGDLRGLDGRQADQRQSARRMVFTHGSEQVITVHMRHAEVGNQDVRLDGLEVDQGLEG